jgi:hypothetical protein
VRKGTQHFNTQYGHKLHCIAFQYNTVQYSTTLYITIQYNTIQHNTQNYNIIQHNAIQYNTNNTIQYNTIQHFNSLTFLSSSNTSRDGIGHAFSFSFSLSAAAFSFLLPLFSERVSLSTLPYRLTASFFSIDPWPS